MLHDRLIGHLLRKHDFETCKLAFHELERYDGMAVMDIRVFLRRAVASQMYVFVTRKVGEGTKGLRVFSKPRLEQPQITGLERAPGPACRCCQELFDDLGRRPEAMAGVLSRVLHMALGARVAARPLTPEYLVPEEHRELPAKSIPLLPPKIVETSVVSKPPEHGGRSCNLYPEMKREAQSGSPFIQLWWLG